ncbi:MAG: DUF6198 family protein [Bacteroidales bacterium]|nr:DUF6198 family protein [Bacteroidales bacterium]
MVDIKNLTVRYGLAIIGQFLIALGVALAVASDLGQGPLPGPAYALSLKGVCGLSLGMWTFLINCLLIIIQLILLRRKFKLASLMQIVASLVFGLLIDLSCWMILPWLHVHVLWQRIAVIILACAVTALGTSVEVMAKAWMLSVEMTINAICQVSGGKFNYVKVGVDLGHVALTMVLCLLFFSNPFGKGESSTLWDFFLVKGESISVAVGLGTVMMSLFVGPMMNFTDRLAKKCLSPILK